MEQMEKLRILLPHWISHNQSHAEEYRKWSAFTREAAEDAVADQIDKAIAAVNQASEFLEQALAAAGGKVSEHGGHGHHH